ncbi:hypothetical protein SS1G_10320 [Sclerotinia sclerotiorum 1980 UF-70]|uniref:Heterokaryon incompatibility domain-containing protein n=1 Tax=Sclerotinia sclerotiorum (strain ATCC 18683 / 1980 / Ss-1) TaxID=665079 RepID=A7EYA5_SCLS1|nr:hypothetical protein SS1G_10320 [Sclerotinia sclerotiorum 1980 UF-70]EDN94447.1 hypothetical protein SS1G_10320 [Sclerotinia sclerotiorum 1980 UF-70]
MDTTEETSTTGLTEPDRLCQPCIDCGVAQLLDDLRDNVPLSRNRQTMEIEFFDSDDDDNEKSNDGFGLSVILGINSERRITVGTAASIRDREGCPVCDLITHILPSEFRNELSGSEIILHLPKPGLPEPPSVTTISTHQRKESEIEGRSREQKLYITTIVNGTYLTFGCIHFATPGSAKTTAEISDHGRRGIIKHEICFQPEMYLLNILKLYDAVELLNEDIQKLNSSNNEEKEAAVTNLKLISKVMVAILQAASQRTTVSQDVQVGPALQILLIDVDENKLVETTTSRKYLALSYVWGTGEVFKITTDKRAELAEEGSLSRAKLPKIVRDAISFTRKLQQRYLWVDALCIEQNKDSMQKATQIQNMDAIYGGAYLTLVAWTAKSSDSSLPGISDLESDSEFRYKPQIIRREVNGLLLENRLSDDLMHLDDYAKISHYETRAWTFQERILSRRCLFFHEREALFVSDISKNSIGITCAGFGPKSRCKGCKVMDVPPKGHSINTAIYSLINAGIVSTAPQLEQYSFFVEKYMELNLTMKSDRLNAFQGLLSYLRPDIGDTVACLPIAWSPRVLLWGCVPGEQEPVRNVLFPSWSWAGWEGRVTYSAFSRSDWEFHIQEIRGSASPKSYSRLLWTAGENTISDEADALVPHASIKILNFEADTVDPASGVGSLPVPPNNHIYVLLAVGISFEVYHDKRVNVLEVKRNGDCFERVALHLFERDAWQSATIQKRSIYLG